MEGKEIRKERAKSRDKRINYSDSKIIFFGREIFA
jgi:hypothetical protein